MHQKVPCKGSMCSRALVLTVDYLATTCTVSTHTSPLLQTAQRTSAGLSLASIQPHTNPQKARQAVAATHTV
jgi:hypothetical protein